MKSIVWLMALVVFTVSPMVSRLAYLERAIQRASLGDKASHQALVRYNAALKGRIRELEAELDEAYESLTVLEQHAKVRVVSDHAENS